MQRFAGTKQSIATAQTPQAVEAAIRALLGALLPSEIAELPRECAPLIEAATMQSIPESAVELARCELGFRGPPEAAGLLREIVAVFVLASERLANIEAMSRWKSSGPDTRP